VASLSKKTGLREFNKKKKYNEWQFLYDPTADRGGIITTPYQPQLQAFGGGQNLNSQPGGANSTNGISNPNGNAFGNSSGSSFGNSFGQSGGMNNSPNSPGGINPPAQPPSTTPQQQ
jgi:hypothetical protein